MVRRVQPIVDAPRSWEFANATEIEGLRSIAIQHGAPEERLSPGFHKRVIEITGSDDSPDRYNSRILVDGKWRGKKYGAGWKVEHYRRNPVFLPMHTYDAPPVGQTLNLYTDAVGKGDEVRKRLRFIVLFTNKDENPLGDMIHQLYKGGFMRASSVGFMPDEYTIIKDHDEATEVGLNPDHPRFYPVLHTTNDLLELSAVPVPGNPNATIEEQFTGEEIRSFERIASEAKEVADEFGRVILDYLQTHKTTPVLVGDVHTETVSDSTRVRQPTPEELSDIQASFEAIALPPEEEEDEEEDDDMDLAVEEPGADQKAEVDKKLLTSTLSRFIENAENSQEIEAALDIVMDEVFEELRQAVEVQTLIFPKDKGWNRDKAVTWAADHDFRTDKVDETGTSFRLRQRNPGEFIRMRTICLSPGGTTAGDEKCRIKAVVGPVKKKDIDGEAMADFLLDVGDALAQMVKATEEMGEVMAQMETSMRDGFNAVQEIVERYEESASRGTASVGGDGGDKSPDTGNPDQPADVYDGLLNVADEIVKKLPKERT